MCERWSSCKIRKNPKRGLQSKTNPQRSREPDMVASFMILLEFYFIFGCVIGWGIMYSALIKFCEERGHCNVPRRYECQFPPGTVSSDGKPLLSAQLGSWLTTQRILKQQNKLRPDRMALLQPLVDEGKLFYQSSAPRDKLFL